jgi:hypothetical protein
MTKKSYPIHDLYIRKLEAVTVEGVTSLPLLSFDDHLLRRFGFVEKISFEKGYESEMKVREVADEVWVNVKGKIQFRWWDLREGSPTRGNQFELMMDEPSLLLVPFGVAFGIKNSNQQADVIRFSTHPEGIHDGDHEFPWERD